MKCTNCRKIMEQSRGDTNYLEAGLNLKLVGIPVYKCSGCGNEEVGIPAIKNLHMLITQIIISMPNIKGPQIKFLRKFLGLTQAELGIQLGGVAPETISKWENDAQTPTTQSIILLKKLADEHIAREWQELRSYLAKYDELENETHEVTPLRDFVQQLASKAAKMPSKLVFQGNKYQVA